jgi:hypothetical protein
VELTISVVRTGGVAGLRRSWELRLDCATAADSWGPLLDACPWEAATSAGTPDRFVYRITAGERSATVPERELHGPWRELTDRVRAESERTGSGRTGSQPS